METIVADVMSTDLIKVEPTTPLREVDDIFLTHNIHHVLVAEGDHLKGIISLTDLRGLKRDRYPEVTGYEAFENKTILDDFTAVGLMTHMPITVKDHDKLGVVAELFLKNHFHAAPVLNQQKKLVGIVTVYDMIKYFYTKHLKPFM